VGGAPPPPQDFAPQGSKNRRNSALGPGFGRFGDPEDQGPPGGEGGSRPLPAHPRGPGLEGVPRPPLTGPQGVGTAKRGIRESGLAAV